MRILNILIDCLICEIGGILYEKNLGAKPYLFPQPVMIIASYDEHGKANAMNAAWGGYRCQFFTGRSDQRKQVNI